MAKTLSATRTMIRQMLRDEFVSGEAFHFPDDELDLYIGHCLVELSDAVPYEVKETLSTTASSKELDISSIEDLLDVDKIEFRVGNEPPDYHNCSIFGNTLRMKTDLTPLADEDVYLYCHKVHQLTEESSTLNPRLEKVLVDGVIAHAALGWINEYRTQLVAAIASISDVNTAVGNMTARITQAINDLTTGRTKIGLKITEANTAIGNMTARLTASIGDLTSGRALIGDKKTEAIAALDAVSTEITQAGSDLTSGRAQIADTRATADTAIDNMSGRIVAAVADLVSGRDLINKINIGGSPEADYANSARTELSIGLEHLNQARGLLGEGVTSDRYQAYAARGLQKVNAHIATARGYLALDVITSEHANFAARELTIANVYASQARAYLTMDIEAGQYANYAAREVQIANASLNQSGGYIRSLTARLNIGRAMSGYQTWANNKLMLYERELKRISKPKISVRYPRD